MVIKLQTLFFRLSPNICTILDSLQAKASIKALANTKPPHSFKALNKTSISRRTNRLC
jgi:hypothetical protein